MKKLGITLALLIASVAPSFAQQTVGGSIATSSGGGGSGTVSSGTIYQAAYYAATGSTVSGSSAVSYTANGIIVTGGSPTTSAPMLTMGQIWNGSGSTAFKAIVLNITDNQGSDYSNSHAYEQTFNGASYPNLFIDRFGCLGANNPFSTFCFSNDGQSFGDKSVDPTMGIGTNYGGAIHGFFTRSGTQVGYFFGPTDSAMKPAIAGMQIENASTPVMEFNNGTSLANSGSLIPVAVQSVMTLAATTPAVPPSTGWIIYTDTADGGLKAINAAGTIRVLASP